jgi:transcriptional regulator with XRE-family HTH domain
MDKSNSAKYLCEALKRIRELSGLSRAELGEKLNRSENHIREIESGRRTPTTKILMEYSDIFEIEVSQIYRLAEVLEKGQYPEFPDKRILHLVLNEILKNIEN